MKSMNICKNCSAQLHAEQKVCGMCGLFIDANAEHSAGMECETHPNRRAVGLCIVCGRPVCSACVVKHTGRIVCQDPEHRRMLQEWSVIHQPDTEFEADAFERNLADGGIEAKTFSIQSHVATHWLNENRVLVFVRKTEMEKAKALLEELHLIGHDE